MRFSKVKLTILAAALLGWTIGGVQITSPTAIAQIARVTLDSLQSQINGIVGGTTTVGKATTATTVPFSGVTGVPMFVRQADADAAYASRAYVDTVAATFLPLSGGALTGDVSTTGTVYGQAGVRVGATGVAATVANQGMLRYRGESRSLQYSDGIMWSELASAFPGSVVQLAEAETKAVVGLAGIPFDNTIPQQTEGTQVLTASITPRYPDSDLLIEAIVNVCEDSNTTDGITCAAFRDAGSDAISTNWIDAVGPSPFYRKSLTMTMRFKVAANSTATTVFKIRAGGYSGSGVTLNSYNNDRLGGQMVSSMSITEIKR